MRRLVAPLLAMACNAGDAAAPDAAIAVDAGPPAPPADLQRWLVGDPADRIAQPRAGVILMGGGPDVDAAFAWQRDRIDGGDVVVLRASGADGYDAYLHDDIGGVDSVETLRVDTQALAASPYVRWALDHAEAVFLAGGDQAVYLDAWAGSPVAEALDAAFARGAVVGGTSAGCAVLGEIVYSASNGTVYSDEALADPYGPYSTLTRRFVELAPLVGVVTDTHFAARDRMGRLLTFAARAIRDRWAARPLGLGIDEGTALVIDDAGLGTVLGAGAVYVLAPDHAPETCEPATPLTWSAIDLSELRDGDTIELPSGDTAVAPRALGAAAGVLEPADPY